MTTIAWDGKTLAVDSMVTSGGVVISTKEQKLFLNVGRFKAVAIAGSIVQLLPLIDWIREGENGDPPKMDDTDSVMCVTDKGLLLTFWHGYSNTGQGCDGVSAGGNGYEIAMGAMDAGATAVEAVKIACKRNIYTGGRVRSYTFEPVS